MSPVSNTGKLGPRAACMPAWPAGRILVLDARTPVRPAGQLQLNDNESNDWLLGSVTMSFNLFLSS